MGSFHTFQAMQPPHGPREGTMSKNEEKHEVFRHILAWKRIMWKYRDAYVTARSLMGAQEAGKRYEEARERVDHYTARFKTLCN